MGLAWPFLLSGISLCSIEWLGGMHSTEYSTRFEITIAQKTNRKHVTIYYFPNTFIDTVVYNTSLPEQHAPLLL